MGVSSWIISERDPDLEGIEPTEIKNARLCDDTQDPWGRLVHDSARELPCKTLRYTLRRSISKVLMRSVMRYAGYVQDH